MFFKSQTLNEVSMARLAQIAPAVFASAPHERTSERYDFIPTSSIINDLTNNGWAVVSAVQTRSVGKTSSLEHNKHALMLCRSEVLGKGFNVGDTIPLLKISNSHNGLSAFHLEAGLFRKACANGLTVPESMFLSPKLRHSNLNKDAVEASFRLISDFPSLMGQVNTLKTIELDNDEKRIFADSASRIIYDHSQLERTVQATRREDVVISQLLTTRRYEDKKNDLWTVLNVVQENAIRGNVKLVGETGKARFTKEVKNIDRDSQINKELMTLAGKMAELKGVKLVA